MHVDPFWLDDIGILFAQHRLHEVLPAPELSVIEQLNAMMRFATYFSVALSLHRRSAAPMIVLAGTAIATALVQRYASDVLHSTIAGFVSRSDDDEDNECVEPTPDNPFMNPLPGSRSVQQQRACPTVAATGTGVSTVEAEADAAKRREMVKQAYMHKQYTNSFDHPDYGHGREVFHTVVGPPRHAYNDGRRAFADALYGNMPSCKDNTYACRAPVRLQTSSTYTQ